MSAPKVVFVRPFELDADLTEKIEGRVVVVDVAFNKGLLRGMEAGTPEARRELRKQFEQTTLALIEALGDQLVAWVDHHPHQAWEEFKDDHRFHFFSREEAPSMPEVLSGEFLSTLGEVDTIIAHGDMDGIISAIIIGLGGELPYPEAVSDATAADTRQGDLSQLGRFLEKAIKADLEDDEVRKAIYHLLTSNERNDLHLVMQAQQRYAAKMEATETLAEQYQLKGKVAVVDAREIEGEFDLTQLLLKGQREVEEAEVAVVLFESKDDGTEVLTVAGPARYNFPELLGEGGGMPFRVTVEATRKDEVINLVNNF